MKKMVVWMVICGIASMTMAADEADKGMTTKLAAGINLQSGNSETMTANASLTTEGEKKGLGSVRAGVEVNYGESTVKTEAEDGTVTEVDETTVENAKLSANAKKTLSEKTFVYVDLTSLYDDIAKVDQRTTVGAGGGTYLAKTDEVKLSVELGLSQVFEEVDGVSDDYLAVRAAERFDYQLSKTAKVWESVEYLGDLSDSDSYLLNSEAGIDAAVNSRLSLRFVVQHKYDSEPAAGLEKGDLAVIAGLSATL